MGRKKKCILDSMVNFAGEAEAQRGCVMWPEPQSSSKAELGLNCARVPASPKVWRLFLPRGFLFLTCFQEPVPKPSVLEKRASPFGLLLNYLLTERKQVLFGDSNPSWPCLIIETAHCAVAILFLAGGWREGKEWVLVMVMLTLPLLYLPWGSREAGTRSLCKWMNKSWFRKLEAAGQIHPHLSWSDLLTLPQQNPLPPCWSWTQHHPLDFKIFFPSQVMSCVSGDELPNCWAHCPFVGWSNKYLVRINFIVLWRWVISQCTRSSCPLRVHSLMRETLVIKEAYKLL